MSEDLRLCWRHNLRLYRAAFGSLLDLTGRTYVIWSADIMADVRRCPDCRRRSGL